MRLQEIRIQEHCETNRKKTATWPNEYRILHTHAMHDVCVFHAASNACCALMHAVKWCNEQDQFSTHTHTQILDYLCKDRLSKTGRGKQGLPNTGQISKCWFRRTISAQNIVRRDNTTPRKGNRAGCRREKADRFYAKLELDASTFVQV